MWQIKEKQLKIFFWQTNRLKQELHVTEYRKKRQYVEENIYLFESIQDKLLHYWKQTFQT